MRVARTEKDREPLLIGHRQRLKKKKKFYFGTIYYVALKNFCNPNNVYLDSLGACTGQLICAKYNLPAVNGVSANYFQTLYTE